VNKFVSDLEASVFVSIKEALMCFGAACGLCWSG